MSVEFGSLSAFKKSVEHVNLNQYITVYNFPLACWCVMHPVCIFVFIVGLVYICVNCNRKITVLLARSDISASNSLSVPQLTAERCHSLSCISAYEFANFEINRFDLIWCGVCD